MESGKLNQSEFELLNAAKTAQAKFNEIGISDSTETEVSYETFLPVSNIPSMGSLYNATLKAQPLKGEDCLLLHDFDESTVTGRFNEVFARRARGVTARDLLVCDELYMAFWFRESTYPNLPFPLGYDFTCKNEECQLLNVDPEFLFKDLEFKISNYSQILQKLKENGGKFTLTLPISKKVYNIAPRKRGSNERIFKFIKEMYTDVNITPPENVLKVLSVASVVNVGETTIRDLVDEILALGPVDLSLLVAATEKYTLNTEVIVHQKCRQCQEDHPTSGYTFLAKFYLPVDQLSKIYGI